MPFSTVVFDWYATLAAPNPDDFWNRLPELIVGAGGVPDSEVVATWMNQHPSDHREHSTSEATYRAWQRRRLDDMFVGCGIDEPARSGLLDEIDDLRYTRLFRVYPDVHDTIDQLKQRGMQVGICSNWDWSLGRQLAHNAIADPLDFVLCSARVGYRKPHPAIFELVLDHAGVSAADILFVGDSWREDIGGARQAGFVPLHIDRGADCPVPDHDGVACTAGLDLVLELCE